MSRAAPPDDPTPDGSPATGAADEHVPVALAPPPGEPHFANLDGYRALGMLMVLAAHVAFATGFQFRDETLGPVLVRMDLGLPIFFVLSGFLLYRPFVSAQLARRSFTPTLRFWRRRALRIFPAYWFALTAILILFGLPMTAGGEPLRLWEITWQDVVVYYGMLQTLSAERAFGGITQSWSIGVELAFYLLLPLYALGMRRLVRRRGPESQVRILLLGAAGLWVVGEAYRVFLVTADPGWTVPGIFWLPAHLEFFAIGMGLAVVSAAATRGRAVPAPLAWMGRHPAAAWGLALAVLFLVSRMEPPPDPLAITGGEYAVRQALYGVAGLLLVTPAVVGDQRRGAIRAGLRLGPVVYLGTVSYGFYLWHMAFIGQVQGWIGAGDFEGSFPVVYGLVFACSLAAATVSYYVVERPFLLLKDRPLRQAWELRPRLRPRRTPERSVTTPS